MAHRSRPGEGKDSVGLFNPSPPRPRPPPPPAPVLICFQHDLFLFVRSFFTFGGPDHLQPGPNCGGFLVVFQVSTPLALALPTSSIRRPPLLSSKQLKLRHGISFILQAARAGASVAAGSVRGWGQILTASTSYPTLMADAGGHAGTVPATQVCVLSHFIFLWCNPIHWIENPV